VALPYELLLAKRNLERHPWHTLAMVLGLALAVLVMIYIPSSMSSFYGDLIDRAVEQNSAHVTVWPPERRRGGADAIVRPYYGPDAEVALTDRTFPRHRDLNGYHALARRAAGVKGVAAVASVVRGDGTVNRGRISLGIRIEGIEPEQYARVVNIAKHFPAGSVPELGPSDAAIGFRMAEKLGIHAGEHLHVATARGSRLMRVRAIFRSGYYDKDMKHAFVSLRTAQRLFRMGNEISALAIRCDDLQQAAAVSRRMDGCFQNKIRNWMDDNASLLAEIATTERLTLFINILVAMVASVGMATVFLMFVHNRQKELAIMRAVGSSRASLRAILILEAMFIWLAGTIIGTSMALGVMAYEQAHPYEVSAETYGIGSFATHPQPHAFAIGCGLAALTMLCSALCSGRRAARLSPVEVIFGG